MRYDYCPNCDTTKEIAEEVGERETIRQCLTCGITWSFTNKKKKVNVEDVASTNLHFNCFCRLPRFDIDDTIGHALKMRKLDNIRVGGNK